MVPILVTAHLAAPISGPAPPQLDALLEAAASYLSSAPEGRESWRISRATPVADLPRPDIPLARAEIGGWLVARSSSPIFRAESDEHEYVNRRLDPGGLDACDPTALKRIVVSAGAYKSYRLPLRVRRVDRVRWFAVGDPETTLDMLRRVETIGKKGSIGYGRVDRWSVDRADADRSWFAADAQGRPVLMRPLPWGDWLPDGLVGARRGYGPCRPPYWHPGLYTEIVEPC